MISKELIPKFNGAFIPFLGAYLKFLRKSNSLIQGDLGRELGISQTYLSQVEQGQKTPSLDFILKYTEYFQLPLHIIFFRVSALIHKCNGDIDNLENIMMFNIEEKIGILDCVG